MELPCQPNMTFWYLKSNGHFDNYFNFHLSENFGGRPTKTIFSNKSQGGEW